MAPGEFCIALDDLEVPACANSRMSSPSTPENRREMEKLAVRILCAHAPESSIKKESEFLLRGYKWHDPICQAVYDAVLALPGASPEKLRELLPPKLTRLGFPDVDWEEFFTPHVLSRDDALALLHRMSFGS